MDIIKKLKFCNYRRFSDFEISFNQGLNILVGDNEAGKSTILLALDIVLSGSRSKVESIGLENLFSHEVVMKFLSGDKKIEDLPSLRVEIYLTEQNNRDLWGKINTDDVVCDGLQLLCEPNLEYSKEIQEVLQQKDFNFPFEYYSITFLTFSGGRYTGYRKFFKYLLLDSSQINNEYATNAYIKTIYNTRVSDSEKIFHENEYRRRKNDFSSEVLENLNKELSDYEFGIKTGSKSNLETDLTILEDGILINNKGKGRQCFIKTEFALQKKVPEKDLDILLLEEPENHLSHAGMKSLIRRISESEDKQVFIATHNSMVCTRLDLRKAILLNSSSNTPSFLHNLTEQTAKFFMKAPNYNLLEFILSKRVMLVEGDAEYILMEALYENVTEEKLEETEIHVISVGGTSFKRYLEVAKLLNIRTAVVRDNDGDFQSNCVDRYAGYTCDNLEIYFDEDNNRNTFEKCLYEDNQDLCENLFGAERRSLSVQDYMLKNKTDSAFKLLDEQADNLSVPVYIQNAIEWIRK